MNSKKRLLIMFFFITSIVLMTYAWTTAGEKKKNTPKAKKTQELKEYKGEKLGSTKDFRENSIEGSQKIDIENYRLNITGHVEKTLSLKYAEIEKMKHHKKVVTLNCVEGWSVKILWEGVYMRDLIDMVKPKKEAVTVIFHSPGGYSTSLPLDYFMKHNIILADQMNGLTLPPERGFPFQLVAEGKWGYKWAKWITTIEFSDNPNYKGFWESRGYSNSGDKKNYFYDH